MWSLPAGAEDAPGRLSQRAIRLTVLALLGLGLWWLALQLQKPVPRAPQRIQQITILQELPPPPLQPELQIEQHPAARTAPDVAFEAPAPTPPPAPVALPEDPIPPEAPAEPLPPDPESGPAPAVATAADSSQSEIAAGAPGAGASAAGTGGAGTGAGGGSNPARWDAAHLGNAKPPYPHLARARGHEGTALILVLVSAAGQPIEVRLKQSSGSGLLDRSALEAVQGWRFVPAQEHGKPVAAWLLIPVVFALQG